MSERKYNLYKVTMKLETTMMVAAVDLAGAARIARVRCEEDILQTTPPRELVEGPTLIEDYPEIPRAWRSCIPYPEYVDGGVELTCEDVLEASRKRNQ